MSFGIFVPGDLRFGRTKRQRQVRRALRRGYAPSWEELKAECPAPDPDLDAATAEWAASRKPERAIALPTPANLKGDYR